MGRGAWQPQSMRSQRVGHDRETEQACTHSTSLKGQKGCWKARSDGTIMRENKSSAED